MKRAALYGRVSTRDKGQDVENQLAELRQFAASQGWQIQAEYIDHESGKNAARPRFRQLFTDAASRRFDVVLFWSLDRLTREGALETLQHLNTLSSYGIGFRSFTEPYLDSCGIFKDAVIAILGTVAKQERIRIQERVRAGLNRAKEKGVKLGRPRKIVDRQRIITLRDVEKLSWPEIARRTRCGQGTVVRAYRSLKDPATLFQKPVD